MLSVRIVSSAIRICVKMKKNKKLIKQRLSIRLWQCTYNQKITCGIGDERNKTDTHSRYLKENVGTEQFI